MASQPPMNCGPDVWGRGATHKRWDEDVDQVVRQIEKRFPSVRCNTYVNHPCPGWDGRSIDVWNSGGRGDPLSLELGPRVRRFVMNLPGEPYIRHCIWQHQFWTAWGGWSAWVPNDHAGFLRHLHLTYYFP